MEKIGFDGQKRLEEFRTGWWLFGFAVGDLVWWLALGLLISKLGYDDLFGAIFAGSWFLYRPLYTFGVRLLATLIVWTPFVVTAGIAYRFKFGDRSRLPTLIWFGAAYVLSNLTRTFFLLFFGFG
jgi:hypothetical protein